MRYFILGNKYRSWPLSILAFLRSPGGPGGSSLTPARHSSEHFSTKKMEAVWNGHSHCTSTWPLECASSVSESVSLISSRALPPLWYPLTSDSWRTPPTAKRPREASTVLRGHPSDPGATLLPATPWQSSSSVLCPFSQNLGEYSIIFRARRWGPSPQKLSQPLSPLIPTDLEGALTVSRGVDSLSFYLLHRALQVGCQLNGKQERGRESHPSRV